jgi:N-carbamoylputrescine amidase
MRLRATVCQLRNTPADFAADWETLVEHVQSQRSELVVLPELAFAPWFAVEQPFKQATWEAAVAAHNFGMQQLSDLAPAIVLGTRPVNTADGARRNQGFVWDAEQGYRAVHEKYYLPDEPGFWEASWYGRGDGTFAPFECGVARAGMQICTELWFMQHARAYGQAGVHLLAVPRATPGTSLDKWLTAGRVAAMISGAFVLSSNPLSRPTALADLGGQGWIIDPDDNVLALTSEEQPIITCTLDLAQAEQAKQTYPRYVREK